MNAMAPCDCGFTGTDPFLAIPNWRIVLRSNDGSIVSNVTVDGEDIYDGLIDGLLWMPDLTSGINNSPNSQLLVGPVNMTYNQSSYQCILTSRIFGTVVSSVGKMTIVGKLCVFNISDITERCSVAQCYNKIVCFGTK